VEAVESASFLGILQNNPRLCCVQVVVYSGSMVDDNIIGEIVLLPTTTLGDVRSLITTELDEVQWPVIARVPCCCRTAVSSCFSGSLNVISHLCKPRSSAQRTCAPQAPGFTLKKKNVPLRPPQDAHAAFHYFKGSADVIVITRP
jgi:hypothetical protein